jgi:hypothetical protein
MRAGWALLRRRDFGLLWAGGLVSETGDWFLLVGLPVWVLQVTGSSLVTATVFLVGANALIGLNGNLARLAGSPLGGVLVEVAGLPGLVIGDAASFLLGSPSSPWSGPTRPRSRRRAPARPPPSRRLGRRSGCCEGCRRSAGWSAACWW